MLQQKNKWEKGIRDRGWQTVRQSWCLRTRKRIAHEKENNGKSVKCEIKVKKFKRGKNVRDLKKKRRKTDTDPIHFEWGKLKGKT